MDITLSSGQLARLLNFRGYGNPAGDYWFIGMEEGGGSPEELPIRADHFREIEDLETAQTIIDPNMNRRKLITSTWTSMCRIVRNISGDRDWCDVEAVRDYQERDLGRFTGETFLTEILPLPKPDINAWPYGAHWPSNDVYWKAIIPERVSYLRELYSQNKLKYTFCYGKEFWPHHKSIFRDLRFETLISDDVEYSVSGDSVVVLTRFFDPSYQGFTIDFIGELCEQVKSVVRLSGERN